MLLRRRLSRRPSAKERPRSRELIASRSGATFSEDPSTVVASNEAGSATLHFAECGAGADKAARITATTAAAIVLAWGSANCSNKSDEGDEEGLHVGEVWFA